MHLFKLFRPFSASSSSNDAQIRGEAEIYVPSPDPSTGSSRKRRRLKRRVTKQSAARRQSTDTFLTNTRLPHDANEAARSAPDLLDERSGEIEGDFESRSWSPALQRHSAASPSSRLRETFSDQHNTSTFPTNAPRYAMPSLGRPPPESMVESPLFGPREQGLFRDELPYDMNADSPLSQLASGWRDTPPYIPRRLPDPPVRNPRGAAELPESTSSKVNAEWRHSPEAKPMRRAASPESRRSSESVDGTYYIVPGGMNVVFQDAEGNEITRVGDFSGRRRPISPIIVQDEYGRELYRTSDPHIHRRGEPDRPERHSRRERESRSRSAEPFGSQRSDYGRSEPPTIVLIDRRGRQIPIMPLASGRSSE